MKKFNFSLLAGLLLLISASVCAENTPEKVQETFKKMYPKVTTVEWMHKSDYHIAGFVSDSHEMNAWFGNNAQWIMTETNVESLEDVPAPVAKAFMQTETPPIQIRYIKIITFQMIEFMLHHPSQITLHLFFMLHKILVHIFHANFITPFHCFVNTGKA